MLKKLLTVKLFTMATTQGIQTLAELVGDQSVTNSIVPVDIAGFTFNILTGRRLKWELTAIMTLGATGGFRLLAHSTVAPSTYNAIFKVVDTVTPAPFNAALIAEAAFTNASAVAGAYQLNAWGTIVAAGSTAFSIQFAQNTATADTILINKGATLSLWQF